MKTLRYFSAAVALVLLASCHSDDELSPFESDPNAVRISVSVGEILSRSNPAADAPVSMQFSEGDRVLIGTEDQSAVVYKYVAGKWIPENGYLKWNKDVHTFEAYYPADVYTGMENVSADQSSAEKIAASDYMSFRQEVAKTDDAQLNMTMQRQTARVVIDETKFVWRNQYFSADGKTPAYEVRSVRIHCNGVENIVPFKQGTKYYALVNPGVENASAIFITLTVAPKGDNNSESEETLTILGIPALAAGSSYNYQLTLGKDKAVVSDVALEDWSTGEVIDNGTAKDDYVMFVTVGGTYSYHIYTLAGLQEVNEILTAPDVTAQMLRADITLYDNFTLPAPMGDETSNWTPIGTKDKPFDGTLYGNNKTITGLVIDNPNIGYQGLVGCLSGSVYNLTLVGCTVKGNGRAGSIVGRMSSGTMNQCTVKATEEYPVVIESKDSYAGGVVAEAIRVAISNCSLECEANASITVKGLDYSSYVGGIAGSHELDGTMSQCNVANSGGMITLEGGNNVGGLVGMNEASSISDCNVDGVSVKGIAYVGGFAGENSTPASITGVNVVKNCKIEGWEGFTAITVGVIDENTTVTVTDGGGNSVKTVPKYTYN